MRNFAKIFGRNTAVPRKRGCGRLPEATEDIERLTIDKKQEQAKRKSESGFEAKGSATRGRAQV